MKSLTTIKPVSEQVDRGGDNPLIINPTEQPTDKKMTFVEWLAKDYFSYYENTNENLVTAKNMLEFMMEGIISDGFHHECHLSTDISYVCNMCRLEKYLSEYHQYFKQK